MLPRFNRSMNSQTWFQAGAEASAGAFRSGLKRRSVGSGRGRIHGADFQPRPEMFLVNHYDMGMVQWVK
jgi:hypothetical protein